MPSALRMAKGIITTSVRLDDDSALAEFLSPVPNADQLGKLLAKKEALSTRAYDDETGTARFVESDGSIATCFTVTDITIDQAEMIEIECEELAAKDEKAFREAVERALGADFFTSPQNSE
jgi:hypothetical protein